MERKEYKKPTTGKSSATDNRETKGSAILRIARRECGIMVSNPIYIFCMVVFPICLIFFFTSLMNEGTPSDMPCGVVDFDNSTTSRALTRRLDAMQTVQVAAHYPNVNEARRAIQRGEIYGFICFPEHLQSDVLAQRQPTISFYYSNVSMLAGNMMFREMKTTTMLGSAAVGAAKLSALGKSEAEIKAFLQPISVDLHMIGNPWANYNVYLSTIMIPGMLMLFIFLITAYSIGTEWKFQRAREWMQMAGGNIVVALTGKLLPQFLIFITLAMGYMWYLFGYLEFPHPGGLPRILLLALLTVTCCQGFGVFAFGLIPSLRMSMSVCSLWAVLGFSMSGATYPVFAMHPMIEALSWLFPLRHYYMIYQLCIFNGFPLADAWPYVTALVAFSLMPTLTGKNIKKAMLEYVYIP